MNNSFAIFSEDLEANKDIIKTLGAECKKLGDTILITDSIDTNLFTDYAIFSSFYIRFFQGIVIFLNTEDHLQYKDSIIGKPMLYLTEEMLKKNNLNIGSISKENMFSVSGGYA